MGPAWVHFSSLIPVGSGTAKTPRLAALLLMVILTGKLRHKTGCLVPPRGVSECDNTMHLVIPCLPSWHIIPIAPLADQKLEKLCTGAYLWTIIDNYYGNGVILDDS